MLTVFSAHVHVLTLIILVPVRPSRENVISMPSVRRNVCARRSRRANVQYQEPYRHLASGDSGQS